MSLPPIIATVLGPPPLPSVLQINIRGIQGYVWWLGGCLRVRMLVFIRMRYSRIAPAGSRILLMLVINAPRIKHSYNSVAGRLLRVVPDRLELRKLDERCIRETQEPFL